MKITMVGDSGVSTAVRLKLPASELQLRGHEIVLVETGGLFEEKNAELPEADVYIISRVPFANTIYKLVQAGKKVIYDLDDDFFSVERSHIGYNLLGPGNPLFLDRVIRSAQAASLVTVTTPALVERMTPITSKIKIIPNAWRELPYLDFKNIHSKKTIGFAGTPTHRTDFELCRDAVLHVLRKRKDVRVAIAGDPHLYGFFKSIPEDQKIYLPGVDFSLYYFLLGHFDIILAPLLNSSFNRSKSALRLIDAGAKKIPWIASPIEPYVDYAPETEGLYARDVESWVKHLMSLIVSPMYYQKFQTLAWDLAQSRHISKIVPLWEEVLE